MKMFMWNFILSHVTVIWTFNIFEYGIWCWDNIKKISQCLPPCKYPSLNHKSQHGYLGWEFILKASSVYFLQATGPEGNGLNVLSNCITSYHLDGIVSISIHKLCDSMILYENTPRPEVFDFYHLCVLWRQKFKIVDNYNYLKGNIIGSRMLLQAMLERLHLTQKYRFQNTCEIFIYTGTFK